MAALQFVGLSVVCALAAQGATALAPGGRRALAGAAQRMGDMELDAGNQPLRRLHDWETEDMQYSYLDDTPEYSGVFTGGYGGEYGDEMLDYSLGGYGGDYGYGEFDMPVPVMDSFMPEPMEPMGEPMGEPEPMGKPMEEPEEPMEEPEEKPMEKPVEKRMEPKKEKVKSDMPQQETKETAYYEENY